MNEFLVSEGPSMLVNDEIKWCAWQQMDIETNDSWDLVWYYKDDSMSIVTELMFGGSHNIDSEKIPANWIFCPVYTGSQEGRGEV